MIKGKINKEKCPFDIKMFEGISMEEKIRKLTLEGQSPEITAEILFTEKKDGVLPGYDIRTDRWELAYDAMNKIMASKEAQTAQMTIVPKEENQEKKTPESAHGSGEKQ